jgi:hypothetical protein
VFKGKLRALIVTDPGVYANPNDVLHEVRHVALKNKPSKTKKFTLATGHKVSFQAGPLSDASVDIFGKVIDPAPISDLPGGHQLAQVYGFREQGQCLHLPFPQHLSLPKPDGPADGCGWDPSQFVVWKNLPKSLMTTQVQTKMAPLHEALLAAPAASEPTVDDVLHQWLIKSVPGQSIPNEDQLQVAWKDSGSGGPYSVQVQQNLANLLNKAFALDPKLVPANLPATLTVYDLKQNLHRSA